MRHLACASLTFLTAVLLHASAQAQMAQWIPPTTAQGHFSNWPVGLSYTSTVGSSAGAPHIRAPGVGGGVPVAWSAATFGAATLVHPNYSTAALTANWPLSGLTPAFGGTSTGGDVMPPVDASGTLIVNGQNWYALTISVTGTALGAGGSLVELQRQGARSPGGDIFSYYAPGSGLIDPGLVDTVRVEYTKEQLGVGELSAIDVAMGVITVDATKRAGPMFPVTNRFYFTLTNAWLNSTEGLTFNAAWTGITSVPADAHTVYGMTWDGASWSSPVIEYSTIDLFGSINTANIEIDALSVYKTNNSDRIVFSLTAASDITPSNTLAAWNQILVYQRASSDGAVSRGTTALQVAGTSAPVLVSTRFGLTPRTAIGPTGEPDDVDATCGLDPNRIDPNSPTVYPVVGLANDPYPQTSSALGFTSVRTTLPDPTYTGSAPIPTIDTLHFQVTGLGIGTYQLGLVVFFQEGPPVTPDDDAVPTEPVQLDPAYVLTSTEIQNNCFNLSNVVPYAVGPTPVRMSARIYGLNFTPQFQLVELRSSWPLSFRY